MKRHTILVVALAAISSIALADNESGVNSQNNESNSYSSGSLSNYQINSNSEARHRVGDAVCATPSLDVGIAGRSNNLDDSGMVYAAVNIPFGGSVCEDAQAATLGAMQYDLHVQQVEQNKRDILFQNKMAQVCLSLYGKLSIEQGNVLREACNDFTPRN